MSGKGIFSIDFHAMADVLSKSASEGVRMPVPTASDDYAIYGVDNEFDFIEAVYADWSDYSPRSIHSDLFVERRIACAMNPEFTERCLVSPAFADVRDEILRRLGRDDSE